MRTEFYSQFETLGGLVNYYLEKYPRLYQTITEARKGALADMPKESVFQAAILKYLKSKKHVCAWKDQAGLYQSKGVPDIICIKNGMFYGFEVKRPFVGKLSEIQKQFHAIISNAGGHVYVVSYVTEVAKILGD